MPAIDTLTALAGSWAAYEPSAAAALTDDELLGSQRLLAGMRRLVDARSASIVAEIAHRSRRELGYDGLAQRLGARTPQLLVQQVTGVTKREAQTLVRVGELMSETADATAAADSPACRSWLAPVTEAIVAGRLSIEAAEAIRVTLGDAQSVDELLEAAIATLLREAASLSVEQLAARARELRDKLDVYGVAEREQALRDRRYLNLIPQSDGMTRITGLLDPESAAEIGAAYDAATSPRRGGPRFVDAEALEREQRLLRDERTTEQIALDALVELVRIGVSGDSQSVLGANKPARR